MSDGVKAMWEDAEDYQRLAKKYGVETRFLAGHQWPYGADYKHHAELEARERAERKSVPKGGLDLT